jgi:predicted amidohydrolase YtcJ
MDRRPLASSNTKRQIAMVAAGAILATIALAGGSSAQAPAAMAATADLVLVGGTVYTVDAAMPWAEAIAVAGDRILAVGSDAEIRAMAGPNTRVIELNGAFVSPGFNDGHVHVAGTGGLLVGVNLLDVHEPVAFAERIAGAAGRMPEGSWITGGSWGAYEQWGMGSAGEEDSAAAVADGPFMPHRDLIDAVTPDHPVLVSRFDRSMYLANSLALELAGIDESTPQLEGGEIRVDADGRLTGILRGTAARKVIQAMTPKSFDLLMREFEAVQKEAREGGITTIQDITSAQMLRVYQATREQGKLTARMMVRPTLDNVSHAAGLGLTRGFGDDWIKFTGYKAWVDGIMGSSGAMFFRDYDHAPGNRGYLRDIMLPESVEGAAMSMGPEDHYDAYPPGNLERLLNEAVPTGIPPHVHAIGTLGVRVLLDIYERVLTDNDMIDSDHRWRMIHAQVVQPGDFERFGRLNLVAEVNPYHISDDMRWMEERIGKERSLGAYAFRDLKEAGAVLVFGSDSPGTNAARYFLSPIYGLYAAVSRQTLGGEPAEGWFPEQRLTIEEAIEAYTKNPAWACFEEDIKGTLTAGKLADIAVFDTNLVDAGHNDPSALLNAKVRYTIVGGRIVYQGQ